MFAPKDKKELIVPVRLDPDSPFSFECTKDLSCFTKCCRDAYIMLTPLDVLRLKRRLGLGSDEFLFVYTTLGLIENTELPVPVLKMRDDPEKTCPFLTGEGCGIYEDRPATCRYYPIGSGIFHNRDESTDERFYALIKEDHCLGHGLGEEITVGDWLSSQGLEDYDRVNAGWTEIILRRKSLGPFVEIPEKTKQMFFTASYNLDSFRRFVFESRFLSIYEIPEDRVEAVRSDEIELLHFGFEWLKFTFFGDPFYSIREQRVEGEMVEVD